MKAQNSKQIKINVQNMIFNNVKEMFHKSMYKLVNVLSFEEIIYSLK